MDILLETTQSWYKLILAIKVRWRSRKREGQKVEKCASRGGERLQPSLFPSVSLFNLVKMVKIYNSKSLSMRKQ